MQRIHIILDYLLNFSFLDLKINQKKKKISYNLFRLYTLYENAFKKCNNQKLNLMYKVIFV